MFTRIAIAALALAGGVASTTVAAQTVTPAEARAIAKEAYTYGLSHVDDYRIMYSYFVNQNGQEYKGPWNQMHHITRLYGPQDTAIQTINSDTLYSFVGMDLRAEPLVLTVPAIDKARYYSVQLIDLQGFNFDYIGTRTTGNEAGSFLIAGPGWSGETPKGVKKVMRTETTLATAAFRTQLFTPADLEDAKKVQAGYKVQTLSEFLGKTGPKAAPIDFIKPLTREQQTSSLEFFNLLGYTLQFAPTHASETDLRARMAKIGIAPGKTFDANKLSPEMKTAIEQGMADAVAEIGATVRKVQLGQQPVDDLAGSREFLENNYLYRATAITLGGNGHSKEEATYGFFSLDADKQALDGAKRYTLRLAPDQMPPAKQFWSVTMYQLPSKTLVANPLNRYLVNSPMLPQFVKDADGGVTFHVQNESPGKDKEANWLPAPKGPFYMVMRLYLPKPEALDGSWKRPALVKVQ